MVFVTLHVFKSLISIFSNLTKNFCLLLVTMDGPRLCNLFAVVFLETKLKYIQIQHHIIFSCGVSEIWRMGSILIRIKSLMRGYLTSGLLNFMWCTWEWKDAPITLNCSTENTVLIIIHQPFIGIHRHNL